MQENSKQSLISIFLFRLIIVFLYTFLVCLLLVAARQGRFWLYNQKAMQRSIEVARAVIEDPITEFDPVLGWKHKANQSVSMESAFAGEDIVFETNSIGARGRKEYQEKLPGTFRIVTLGDSFTFGNVKSDATWPAILERNLSAKHSTQVINLAVSGYGIDQMFLSYRDSAKKLKADIIICAAIADDFRRVFISRWSSGYQKPVFEYGDNGLELTNTPLQKRLDAGEQISEKANTKFSLPEKGAENSWLPFIIVNELAKEVKNDGANFLFVYLPTYGDLEFDLELREILNSWVLGKNISFIDLTEDFRKELGYANRSIYDKYVTSLIRPNINSVFRDDGHYNNLGNELVAKILIDRAVELYK